MPRLPIFSERPTAAIKFGTLLQHMAVCKSGGIQMDSAHQRRTQLTNSIDVQR